MEIVVDGNEIFDFIKVVLENKEAKDIEFRNCNLTEEDLKELSNNNYERIAFIDCTIEDTKEIDKIHTKSLSFTNTKIKNYNFLLNMSILTHLTIVNGKLDVLFLQNLKNLEYLRLSNSHIENITNYKSENLKYLFIDNTNIMDLTFIKNYPNLELLSISEEQETSNKEEIKELRKNIKIIRDSIMEMEVYPNE